MKAYRESLEAERVSRDADQIRARCIRFSGFVKEAWHVLEPNNPLKWSWHLDCLCDHLQAISEGRISPWIIFNVPPGSSKSMIVSVMWQAWEWGPGGKPSNRFVSTSFDIENVRRDTRKTRDLIQSAWYRTLWPEIFDEEGKLERSAETSFANKHMGSREGVAFISITGKRGDRMIIDDPHSVDGAESEVERNKATRRFLEGGLNRLNDQSTSAIVVVMQRLHEADLTGVLLAQNIGFIHIMIPMEFEPERACETCLPWKDPRTYDGQLMDPVRMPREAADKLKKVSDYSWAGQYQQRPAPREGGMFKIEAITGQDNCLLVDIVPAGAQRVRGWDIAGSTRKTSPYTVGAMLALVGQTIYIEHIERARAEIDQAETLIVNTARHDAQRARVLQSIPQDPGSAGKSQKVHLANRLAGLEFRFSPETGEKQDRAIPFASMCNAGCVRLVRGPWNSALIDEMRNFPGSTYKDQIDALSRAFMEIAKLMGDEEEVLGAPIFVGQAAE